MFGEIKIAPSILSANFMDIERDVRLLEEAGADIIHVDVMDGHFVPNLTIGPPFIRQLRRITNLPLDLHLMISNPMEQIDWYLESQPEFITVHIEAFETEEQLHDLISHIRQQGVKPAVTLKPDKPIESLDPFIAEVDMILVMSVFPGFSGQSYIDGSEKRVAYIAQKAETLNPTLLIEVDGGVSAARTAGLVAATGADVLVAGSAVFDGGDLKSAVYAIRQAGRNAQEQFRP